MIRSRTIYIPEKREQEDYNDMTMIEINSKMMQIFSWINSSWQPRKWSYLPKIIIKAIYGRPISGYHAKNRYDRYL